MIDASHNSQRLSGRVCSSKFPLGTDLCEYWKVRPSGDAYYQWGARDAGGAIAVSVTHAKAAGDDLAVLFTEGAIGRWSDAELLDRFVTDRGDLGQRRRLPPWWTAMDRWCWASAAELRATGTRPTTRFRPYSSSLPARPTPCGLRRDDSLGRWLYGVSVRVARRAGRRR